MRFSTYVTNEGTKLDTYEFSIAVKIVQNRARETQSISVKDLRIGIAILGFGVQSVDFIDGNECRCAGTLSAWLVISIVAKETDIESPSTYLVFPASSKRASNTF